MKIFTHVVAALALGMSISSAAIAGPVEIELEPIRHSQAQLVVAGPEGTKAYDQSALESIAPVRMTTTTPWRQTPAAFDGVLLTDLLDENGLSDVAAINVVAENDYVVRIPSEVWKKWPIVVATRVNGRTHSRRARGPIQFILPMSDNDETAIESNLTYWVWMAARIEVAE